MQKALTLSVLSDVHYAGAAERQRVNFLYEGVQSAAMRCMLKLYRRYIWLHKPFAHNHLLDEFIMSNKDSDFCVANGDYSCDSGFIGVSDDAACASALECLAKLRARFGSKFQATFGDHEIGKTMMGGHCGGLRLQSLKRAQQELQLQTLWQVEFGSYLLIGITSTLLAYPIYEPEALPDERVEWRSVRAEYLCSLAQTFAAIRSNQRVLLFCHDPTALPFLIQVPEVAAKLDQIERTILGHLHSPLVFFKSRLLAGMPAITFLGHTPLRLSQALRQARHWNAFKPLLCPSLAGIELLKDGGFYTVKLDPTGQQPAEFRLHQFRKLLKNL
ncbi:MAG TPA: hypothetical protein VGE41_07355 [Verrucomicrobiae bacterium]